MKTKRALKQLEAFKKQGKEMRLAAESWKSDFQILISTIMSARTRDETTIPVAASLFKKYTSIEKLAKARLSEVKKIIRPVNFHKNKARFIVNCAKVLVKDYNSKVPHDFDSLISLPGVGRKTANVFLSEVGYDSIGVDTHVAHISRKMGWAKSSDPEKIENDLKELFPKKYWKKLNSTLVRFGKTFTSRKEKDALIEEIKKIKS